MSKGNCHSVKKHKMFPVYVVSIDVHKLLIGSQEEYAASYVSISEVEILFATQISMNESSWKLKFHESSWQRVGYYLEVGIS